MQPSCWHQVATTATIQFSPKKFEASVGQQLSVGVATQVQIRLNKSTHADGTHSQPSARAGIWLWRASSPRHLALRSHRNILRTWHCQKESSCNQYCSMCKHNSSILTFTGPCGSYGTHEGTKLQISYELLGIFQ